MVEGRHVANCCPGQNKGTSFAGKLKEELLALDADFLSEKLVSRCHVQTIHIAFYSLLGSGKF